MGTKQKKQPTLLHTGITVCVILFALGYLYLTSKNRELPAVSSPEGVTRNEKRTPSNSSKVATGVTTQPSSVAAHEKPKDELPAGFPADRVVRTQPPTDVVLPPDLQKQLQAPPPELPAELQAQLNAPPPEMPEDLKAQLNAPPPEIPEDIKRAMQIPPRIVSIDEVNDVKSLKHQESGAPK